MVKYQGYITILDLNNEIHRRAKKQISKEDLKRLEKLQKNRDFQKKYNYKAGGEKRKIRNELKKKGKSEEQIKRAQNKVFSYNLGIIDNEMNMISKKSDFKYVINDEFTGPYSVSAKKLLSTNPALDFTKKYEKSISKAVDKEYSEEYPNYKKIKVLEKLLAKVRFNLSQLEKGYSEYDDKELEEFEQEMEDEKMETDPPMLVEFEGYTIHINFWKKMARPKKKNRYMHIKFYQDKLDELRRRGMTFEVTKTTYSRRIKTSKFQITFNENGGGDDKTLHLINNVRNDAIKYIENGGSVRDTYINYFDLIDCPVNDLMLSKVDIKAAYWNYALKTGVISKETDDMFHRYYEGYDYDIAKKSRLKALGSLATTKKITKYINGKPDYENEEIITEDTKDIYLEVCRGVDDLMKQCTKEVEGCYYYYWDCIFVSKEYERDVIEFFMKRGYDVSVGETRMEAVKVNDIVYLLSHEGSGKMYMTRKEHRHILEDPFWYERLIWKWNTWKER